MSTYLLINILIIIGPLMLSFERKIGYYRKWPSLLLSVALTSAVFVTWDVIAHQRNDWQFSQLHTMPWRILSLPVEELLFFLSVPFSCLFLYETIALYIPEKKYSFKPGILIALVILFLAAAFIFSSRYYTFTVSLFCASVMLYFLFNTSLLLSRRYLLFIAVSYVPFFIINYLLTSLPVVTYNPKAILGIRVLSIPVEDFFYSFSLLSTYFIFYKQAGKIYESIGFGSRTGRAVGSHKAGLRRP